MKKAMLFLIMIMLACQARANDCTKLARPNKFNQSTAMRAVFCYYNDDQGGTLLPLADTVKWNEKKADTLVTPLVVATYKENGQRKGVLAVERQMIDSDHDDPNFGSPDTAHVTQVWISVYLFRYNGKKWVFDKGKKYVTQRGTWGAVPPGHLVRLGADRYGLLFNLSDEQQGYSEYWSFVITLSTPRPEASQSFDTGDDNSGTCTNNPKKVDKSIGLVYPCSGYQANPQFVAVPGSAYYMIRLDYRGNDAGIKKGIVCYRFTDKNYVYTSKNYVLSKDKHCASYQAVAGGWPDNSLKNVCVSSCDSE